MQKINLFNVEIIVLGKRVAIYEVKSLKELKTIYKFWKTYYDNRELEFIRY